MTIPMRRNDRQMDEKWARDLVDRSSHAILCMTHAQTGPYAVPVSHILEGDHVYFHCASEGTKLEAIRFDHRVSLVCTGMVHPLPDAFSTLYESAIVYGNATIVNDRDEKIHALRLLAARYAAGTRSNTEKYIAADVDATVVVSIRITGITGKARLPKRESQP